MDLYDAYTHQNHHLPSAGCTWADLHLYRVNYSPYKSCFFRLLLLKREDCLRTGLTSMSFYHNLLPSLLSRLCKVTIMALLGFEPNSQSSVNQISWYTAHCSKAVKRKECRNLTSSLTKYLVRL